MNSKSVLLRTMCLTLFLSSIILTELIGFLRSDYNLINHFISELGATGAEYSRIINYFGFVPTAFSALIIALLLQSKFSNTRLSRAGLLLVGSGVLLDTLVLLFFLATMVVLLREALVKTCITTLD